MSPSYVYDVKILMEVIVSVTVTLQLCSEFILLRDFFPIKLNLYLIGLILFTPHIIEYLFTININLDTALLIRILTLQIGNHKIMKCRPTIAKTLIQNSKFTIFTSIEIHNKSIFSIDTKLSFYYSLMHGNY